MDAWDGRLDAKPGLHYGSPGLWCSLALVFLIRAVHPTQPIVENYVGRQVPTAMVARNLERGSGFFHPQLDTAPFPNYFVVEPPIYEALVVALRRAMGWRIEASGRIVSALATTLAALGVFELARRRRERTQPSGRWPPLECFRWRFVMAVPSSPTHSCWGQSSRDWPPGTDINRQDAARGWPPGGYSWRLASP